MTDYTARALTTDRVVKVITQAHAFQTGEIVIFDGLMYSSAQADSPLNCQSVLMVSQVIDAMHFTVCQNGFVNNLSIQVFAGGVQYYLDPDNPGQLTPIKPFVIGQIVLPCFTAIDGSSGWFDSNSGSIVQSNINTWETIIADQTMVVNTGYFTNSAGPGPLNLLLPVNSVEGDSIEIISLNSFGFQINQSTVPGGQQIFTPGGATTVGAGGNVLFVETADKAILVCEIPNLIWHLAIDGGNGFVT